MPAGADEILQQIRSERYRLAGVAVSFAILGGGALLGTRASDGAFPAGFGVIGLVLAAVALLVAANWRVYLWARYGIATLMLTRDAPSPSRTCSRCGEPMQSSTWASGGAAGGALPPLDVEREICVRCRGGEHPASRRAVVRAEHRAILAARNQVSGGSGS